MDIAGKMKTENDPLYTKMNLDQVTEEVCELYTPLNGSTGECAFDGTIVNVNAGCKNPGTYVRYGNYYGGMK